MSDEQLWRSVYGPSVRNNPEVKHYLRIPEQPWFVGFVPATFPAPDIEAAEAAVNEVFEMNELTNVAFSERDVVDVVLAAAYGRET